MAGLVRARLAAPRLYWRDSGLVHALLHLGSADLAAQPWVGASWEGWVIEQILSVRRARGEAFEAFYFRTHDGLEADLVLETDAGREVIEIKLTSSPSPEHFARLAKVSSLIHGTRQILISRTRTNVVDGARASLTLDAYLRDAAG